MSNERKFISDNSILMEEWNWTKNEQLSIKPVEVSYGSALKVWWICKEGHEWKAQIKSRNNGAGCPIFSGHQILVVYNDLATVNSSLASEWHQTKNGNLTPNGLTKSNSKKVW